MITLKSNGNINQLLKDLKVIKKDIPYVTKTALNDLAFDARSKIGKEVYGKLNVRVKKLNAWRVKKATKKKPIAVVFIDEFSWQYKVLKHHYYGGDRPRKGLEKAMIYFGYMDSTDILTPPPGKRIAPSKYLKIIAQLKLVYKSGYMANETKRSKKKHKTERFFLIRKRSNSHLYPGIYTVRNRKISNILRVASRPNYEKRLNAEEIIQKVFDRRAEYYFIKAARRAFKIRSSFGSF